MFKIPYHSKDLNEFSFLITGGAGFIGSNLVEYLLKYGAKKVRILDNLITGFEYNIDEFKSNPAFEFINGDIRDLETCKRAVEGMDYVSHQAALGSVPRSINDPITNNEVNVTGFLNMLCALKDNHNIKRLVYAASSSTYGDNVDLPKSEDKIGRPLSPYAVTKYVNELYADVFAKIYGIETIGLRYFNVFGPKQCPEGAYAAVIPLFIQAAKEGRSATINGDGEQTRDFTFIENVIQANMKSFFVESPDAVNQIYNVACNESVTLNQLWELINKIENKNIPPVYQEYRLGDIKNSLADISKAKKKLDYQPEFDLKKGLEVTINYSRGLGCHF